MDNRARKPILPYFEGKLGDLREMRFWSHVDMRGPDECWDWQACRQQDGYGRFKAGDTTYHSNRVAWTLKHRSDPGELVVRHACDRPQCCNPAHLVLGTVADNTADKMARGRWRGGDHRGVRNPRARLTPDQVREVVEAFKRGESNTAIAARLPIGHSLVSRIRVGLSWRAETESLGWMPTPQFSRKQGGAAHG